MKWQFATDNLLLHLSLVNTISAQEQLSAPKKDLHAIPFFTPNDSPWRELISQADVDVDMQRIEEKLQGLSFASNAAVTAPNFTSVSKKLKIMFAG